MAGSTKSGEKVRFGFFEADLAAGELRRRGLKVKLQDRPFQILALLLSRPGQIVTREELRQALWPADTFVDFNNGINIAVNKLREALGDSAENPSFIETLGRRGYRWIPDIARSPEPEPSALAEARAGQVVEPAFPSSSPPPAGGLASRFLGSRRGVTLLTAGVTFALTALLSYWWLTPPPAPKVLRSVEITHSGRVEAAGRIVVDGGRLLYLEREGHRWKLVQTSVSGGEAEPVTVPFESPRNTSILDLSPDRSEFLVGTFVSLQTAMPLWIMPVAGGSPRRVGEITSGDAMWYPGGQRILYAKGSDLWVVERDGSQTRKFVSTGGSPWWLAWSPDHRVLRFTLTDPTNDSRSIWEVAADGTHLHPLLPGWSNPGQECCGLWTPDGRYFLFSSRRGGRSNIWALREPRSFFRKRPEPVQLTAGPSELSDGVLDGEGKRLFVSGKQPQVEIVQYDAKSRQFLPYLPGTKAWSLSLSRDGQWVAHDAADALWRSRADGSARLQLTFGPEVPHDPRWSPDGKQIAFWTTQSGQPTRIYVISSEGGPPREIARDRAGRARPDWSPDGGSLVFEVEDAPDPRADALYVVDLKTEQVSELAGSAGMSFPRWSPVGQTIAALTNGNNKLMLFDLKTRQWTTLAAGTSLTSPVWSAHGTDVYFQDRLETAEPVYRFRLRDHRSERVTGCEELLRSGAVRCALLGLDPDDSPVLQVLRHMTDIYALDLDLP